uniref:Peptidase C1A papain C-terminal domain-containing protein n=1 Tax=Panagrolaimus sp. JU765 TaxID=591449 RepID=A0AC34R209_9BILA
FCFSFFIVLVQGDIFAAIKHKYSQNHQPTNNANNNHPFVVHEISSRELEEIRQDLKGGKLNVNDAMKKCPGRWLEINDTLFDAAVKHFDIKLQNDTDKYLKAQKFMENIARAQNLTKEIPSAFFGVTNFSFMDLDEFKNNYLMKPISIKDIPKLNTTPIVSLISRTKRAAKSVDLRKNAVNPIKNQGTCGCCWAFTTVSTMETAYYKKKGKLIDLSEQQFVNCDTQNAACSGGWMSTAYNYAQTSGIPLESANIYQAMKGTCTNATGQMVNVANYTQLNSNDITRIMNALNQGYSVGIAMKSGTYPFMYYRSGILSNSNDCTDDTVDHAVVIVGYGTQNGTDYWIVRNHWSTLWGEEGYVRIKRGINYCNMELYPFFVDVV